MRAFEVAYITGVESEVMKFLISSELGPTFFHLKPFRGSVRVAIVGLAQIMEFKMR